jgi:MOSC domain-containing protein YiiM
MGDTGFVRRFRQAGRPGLYCRVLQPGTVQAGDPVALEPYSGVTVTVIEMFEEYYQPSKDEVTLRRYLDAPIDIRSRRAKEEQIKKLLAV